ncbi:hypothetical protein [Cellulosimicrobium cellulans]|nr:hypothetical protein [Cellulosimicrobium cellulans]
MDRLLAGHSHGATTCDLGALPHRFVAALAGAEPTLALAPAVL